MKLISLVFLIGFSHFIHAQPKQTILWGVGNQPPRLSVDAEGNLSGQGGIQQTMLEEGLKGDYLHKHVNMNWARFEAELEKGSQVCSSFVFKTKKREQHGVFSIPWHIDLAHQLIMRRATYEELGKPSQVSLNEIIALPNLIGSVELGRSYSNLDSIIVGPNQQTNLMIVPISQGRLLSMLNVSRVDYMIEYPYVASHTQETLGFPADDIVSVPIEEIKDFAFTRVGCANTPWGKQVIGKVNKFIKQIRNKPSYLELLKMIHHDQEDLNLVEKVYHEEFLTASE